jgi:hypothetical protein
MDENTEFYFIEQITSPEDAVKDITHKSQNKSIFNAYLQEADKRTANGFKYSRGLVTEGLKPCETIIDERNFLGELGHPFIPAATDPLMVRMRLLSVDYKYASHRMSDLHWEGNMLIGKIETLNTPHGHIMANLVNDGVRVGFSLRGFGKKRIPEDPMERQKAFQEGIDVIPPFKIVTYDCVQNPAAKSAKMLPLTECDLSMDALCESVTYPSFNDVYDISLQRIQGQLLSNITPVRV